jgi:HAD superfamily hydrolase (TIGR01509 family)
MGCARAKPGSARVLLPVTNNGEGRPLRLGRHADGLFVRGRGRFLARTDAGRVGRARAPQPADISGWFESRGPELFTRESDDEVDWLAILGACFSELGCSVTDDDVRLYAQASLWEGELAVTPEVHAVLDRLRARSLKLGIVSNTALPGWLLEPAFSRQGLTDRVDSIVLSSEVGKRKPHPAIFERALDDLGVRPQRALFVGDRRFQDVLGAKRRGMRTVLARWFRDDVHPDGARPDFEAGAPLEVLEIVDRLNAGR